MKQLIANVLKQGLPPRCKVLLRHFGFWPTVSAVARFGGVLAVLAVTFLLPSVWLSRGPVALGLLLETALFWHLKQFDILGKLVFSSAILRENVSQIRRAKLLFLVALNFLKDGREAYEGLARVARSRQEWRQLAQLVRRRERKLSAPQALIVARSLVQCGDREGARVFYQLADKLQPSGAAGLEL